MDKTYLKKFKASEVYMCAICENRIEPEEVCYRETDEDHFLQWLHAKKFCSNCYQKYGDNLLNARTRKHARLRERRARARGSKIKGPLNNYLEDRAR